jgi:ADP-dependent NAD(P)H-hydrate dehydratase / NAD(P)H-hydrate epimerase
VKAVVTPAEMQAIDAAAADDVEVLIRRAGWAVARSARRLLGGTYGKRVTIVAGPGNNGADGLAAGEVLRRWGVRTDVIRVSRDAPPPATLPACDLVVDAAYGTGFRGEFVAPDPGEVPVLAVDIPSGVDGLTGTVSTGSRPFVCVHTCTFAAFKPGLLFGEGPTFTGSIEVADIGLPTPSMVHLLDEPTARTRLPHRSRAAHKWHSALHVVGGSNGMNGAPSLASRAAMRAGAGMVRLSIPGEAHPTAGPNGTEVVGVAIPDAPWADEAIAAGEKCRALVIGPGLGRSAAAMSSVRELVLRVDAMPILIDADALAAMAGLPLADRPTTAGVVLTPHDGEYRLLTGRAVGDDRLASTRDLAREMNAVVLLKGPTTVVADPNGRVELVTSGDSRLATAGSGDVLSGIIGALLAHGLPAFEAASTGAFIHGAAASLAPAEAMVAGDIIGLLREWLGASDPERRIEPGAR